MQTLKRRREDVQPMPACETAGIDFCTLQRWQAADGLVGGDHAILAARHALYLRARELNPARWSVTTRNWSFVGAVTLNPERDSIIKTHLAGNPIQQLAA